MILSEGGARDSVQLLHEPLQTGHLFAEIILFVYLREKVIDDEFVTVIGVAKNASVS